MIEVINKVDAKKVAGGACNCLCQEPIGVIRCIGVAHNLLQCSDDCLKLEQIKLYACLPINATIGNIN